MEVLQWRCCHVGAAMEVLSWRCWVVCSQASEERRAAFALLQIIGEYKAAIAYLMVIVLSIFDTMIYNCLACTVRVNQKGSYLNYFYCSQAGSIKFHKYCIFFLSQSCIDLEKLLPTISSKLSRDSLQIGEFSAFYF